MSNYKAYTQHPFTGEFSMATWLDDHYAPHHYGVRFQNGDTFNPAAHDMAVQSFDDRMYEAYCEWWKKCEPNPDETEVTPAAYEELGRIYQALRESYNF